MINDRLLSRQFSTGDVVRITSDSGTFLSPFPGRVLYSNHESGLVTVQFPWGVEQAAASTLLIDSSSDFSAPIFDTSYHTWEKSRYSHRIIKRYEDSVITPLYRLACRNIFLGMNEMRSFVDLCEKVGSIFTTNEIRSVISGLMESGRRLAIYRKDAERKYKKTRSEARTGLLSCPRCKQTLKSRTYRKSQTVWTCPSCGFCISPEDII